MSIQEGPRDMTIPAITFKTCSGCRWFYDELVQSGKRPVSVHNCQHPQAERIIISKGNPGVYDGHNLFFQMTESGYIQTPDWCPVLPIKENEQTLNIVAGIINDGTPHI